MKTIDTDNHGDSIRFSSDQLITQIKLKIIKDDADQTCSTKWFDVLAASKIFGYEHIEATHSRVIMPRSQPDESLASYEVRHDMKPALSIIVVTYNSQGTIEKCLKSLLDNVDQFDTRIIVVDNASSDKTLDIVRGQFGGVEIVSLNENVGFGRANNIGFDLSTSELYYLHNADAYLVPVSLQAAIEAIRANSSIGVVGLPLMYPDGSPQGSAYLYTTVWKKAAQAARIDLLAKFILSKLANKHVKQLNSAAFLKSGFATTYNGGDQNYNFVLTGSIETRTVDWVCGASMLIRGAIISDGTRFDENFFMYYEDEDICRSINNLGYKIVSINAPPLTHDCGWSLRRSKSSISTIRINSARYFIEKYYASKLISKCLALMLLKAFPKVW